MNIIPFSTTDAPHLTWRACCHADNAMNTNVGYWSLFADLHTPLTGVSARRQQTYEKPDPDSFYEAKPAALSATF